MSARVFLPPKIARRLPWQASWLFTFLVWDMNPRRALDHYRYRIASLEARISAHERALAAAFEYAGIAAPEGFPPPRDRHGLHSVDGGAA